MLKKIWDNFLDFFSDAEDPNEPLYDPVHFGAMIIIVICVIGVLFWLLWTMLVFGGGIFKKIVPAIQVAFTNKTLRDFGWVGYPFELGVFEGFIGNVTALAITIGLITGIWWVFKENGTKPSS